MRRHVVVFLAFTLILSALSHIDGQDAADPPAAGCQPGINVTFYDLTQSQAKYLSTQFPFLHGPGELLDTLKVSDSKIVSKINFGPDSAKNLDGLINKPLGWPRATPPTATATVAMFSAKLMITLDASWTFFVVSNSPMQFILSQEAAVMGTLATGSEPETNGTITFGVEQFITFNLTKGLYDLSIEWHGGLPDMPPSDPMLMLEYSYTADKEKVPSPSVPGSPRMVVPANMMYTSCSDSQGLSSTQTPAAAAASPAPAPAEKPQPASEASPTESPPPAPAAVTEPPASNDSIGCSAIYSLTGPWYDDQDKTFSAVVNFEILSTSQVLVPYDVIIGGAFWSSVSSPYNMEMTTGPSANGVFSGQVVGLWQSLGSPNPVGIGATFASDHDDFTPTILLVNGDMCSLQGAK